MQSYFLDRLTAGPRKGPAVSLSKILFDKLKSIFKTFIKVLKMR